MLPLLKINLLPYREALQAKQKKQFQTLLLGAAVIGFGLAALGYVTISTQVSRYESRNQILKNGIKKLEDEIVEIDKLKDQRKNFIARQRKVEELSNRRFEAARILDTLNTITPQGLYLTSIEAQDANTYIINGKAFSDAKTAAFMSALPGPLFDTPELLNIKRVNNTQEFSIKVRLNIVDGFLRDTHEMNNSQLNSVSDTKTNTQQGTPDTTASAASTASN